MKKRYVLLIIVIISVVIFNVPKSYANKKLDSVELKENNDINKKAFAMYVENNLHEYEPYTEDSNYFPNSLKYHYNESMSKCVDSNEEVVEGILTHNEDNSVTVTSNRTVYCYLYFDLDKVKPTLTDFKINDGKEYTNINPTNIKLTWNDEDINEYCINKTNSSDNCEWKTIEEIDRTSKTKTMNYTLENGLNNLYAYIRDLAGNVSNNINKNITLDTSKPGVPTVALGSLSSIDNNYTNVKSQTVTVTYNDEDIESYCISLNDTCTSYVTAGLDKSSKKITISNYDLGTDGSKTIKVWLKDMAGNISENPGSITKTLDTQPPVINNLTVSGVTTYSNVNYVKVTNPNVTITWSNDDVVKYCMNNTDCTPGTNINAKTVTAAVTLTNNAANTIHAKIIDKAGNVSADKTYGLTVDTAVPGVPTVSINSNATYTISNKVTVSVTNIASDVAYYCVGESNCNPTTAHTSTTLTISNYALANSNGSKTVCVRIKDKAGNIGTAGCDSITLDISNPSVSVPVVSGTPGASSIVVTSTVTDAVSGLASVTCSNSGNKACSCSASGSTYTCTSTGLAEGTSYTITVTAKDNAGRTTSSTSAGIKTAVTSLSTPSIFGCYMNKNQIVRFVPTDGSCFNSLSIISQKDANGASGEAYCSNCKCKVYYYNNAGFSGNVTLSVKICATNGKCVQTASTAVTYFYNYQTYDPCGDIGQ